MKKILLILTFIGILAIDIIQAQNPIDYINSGKLFSYHNNKRAQYKTALLYVPLAAEKHGIRIDIELKKRTNSFVIGPTMFVDNNYNNYVYSDVYLVYKKMQGAGLKLNYKLNFAKANDFFIPYFSIGSSYSYKLITTEGRITTEPTSERDIEYIVYFYGTKDVAIHRVGIDALLGIQITPLPRFVVDLSWGLAACYNFSETEKELIREKYSRNDIDTYNTVAYSGIRPVFELKFGLKI